MPKGVGVSFIPLPFLPNLQNTTVSKIHIRNVYATIEKREDWFFSFEKWVGSAPKNPRACFPSCCFPRCQNSIGPETRLRTSISEVEAARDKTTKSRAEASHLGTQLFVKKKIARPLFYETPLVIQRIAFMIYLSSIWILKREASYVLSMLPLSFRTGARVWIWKSISRFLNFANLSMVAYFQSTSWSIVAATSWAIEKTKTKP